MPYIWCSGDDPTDPTRKLSNWDEWPEPRATSLIQIIEEDVVAATLVFFTLAGTVGLMGAAFYYRKSGHFEKWVRLIALVLLIGLIATFLWIVFTSVMV